MNQIVIFISLVFCLSLTGFGQEVWLNPNRGQWDENIEYQVDLQMGDFFVEKDGFTYSLNDSKQTYRHSHGAESEEHHENYKAHVIKTKFVGSSWAGGFVENNVSSFYQNFFIGNQKSKWKSKVFSYTDVLLEDYYPNIDLRLEGKQGLKYSIEVNIGGDLEELKINYEGHSDLRINEEGELIIKNRFGEITEGKPIAWSDEEGNREDVPVHYKLKGNTVIFEFPEGYDNTKKLIIDPSITFSTFTGSTADNWGMTATPDSDENLFGGGVVFNTGYPVTVGVYNPAFSGGSVDIGITKFTADGTALLYSTYLGGTGDETPNSTVCSLNGELFVFGLTSSADFPLEGISMDDTYNGGPNLSANANGLGFTAGSDLFVARFSQDGSSLIASTYVGGSDNDGLNTSNLKYNYGDQFRGEIILDNAGSVYVTSNTKSADFPVTTAGSALSGTQDAVIFKMPITLDVLSWSRYFGGGNIETGNSVQIASNGDVFVAGGTSSAGLAFNNTFSGGLSDGYVARFDATNGDLIAGTYIGAAEYDQAYFVQLDIDDNVYVLGQTESDLGITPGLFGNANSGQFINKYSTDLGTQIWKTMIGSSTGHVEISPTAFLISDCYDIYLSGWGGDLNQNSSVSQALFSSTNGFPVTIDAYQPATSGSNFYIAVLSKDAGLLKYGTFMGGFTNSPDHVDGGTSRFDKIGNIYHAVCAACGGDPNGFTTNPGVWSTTNGSSNCNMATFKFQLSTIEAIVSNPEPAVCIPDPVNFINNSSNGNQFFWDFGDGDSSDLINPSHFYTAAGIYDVSLIVSDTNGCYLPDTTSFVVTIGDYNAFVTDPPAPICPNIPYQLSATNGVNYDWSPGQYLSDSTIADPIATISQTTNFRVIVSDTCGVDTLYITLEVYDLISSISNDTSICLGTSVQLNASGGGSYSWSPSSYLNNTSIENPISTPLLDIEYFVEIVSPEGCILNDSVTIEVFSTPPMPVIEDSLILCNGESIVLNVSGASDYYWSPDVNISAIEGASVVINPTSDMYYYCDFVNACETIRDSVFIDVKYINVIANGNAVLCPGDSTELNSQGAITYQWLPNGTLSDDDTSTVIATPNYTTVYYVYGTSEFGCIDSDSVVVEVLPEAEIHIAGPTYANVGDYVTLTAISTTQGNYLWTPSDYLTCTNCQVTIANPNQDFTYTVSYIDENGCGDLDSITILYPSFYVPNSFTPDGDAFNNEFAVKGAHLRDFHMEIYNRWGEIIFESYDQNIGWDGTYNGKLSQDGVYVWKISAKLVDNQNETFVGHVSLIR